MIARSRLIAGGRSTNVTSVCQLFALPCSESIGRIARPSPDTVGCGLVVGPSSRANASWPSSVAWNWSRRKTTLCASSAARSSRDRGRGHVAADPQAADDRAERAAGLGDRDVLVPAGAGRARPRRWMVVELGHAKAPFRRPWLSTPAPSPGSPRKVKYSDRKTMNMWQSWLVGRLRPDGGYAPRAADRSARAEGDEGLRCLPTEAGLPGGAFRGRARRANARGERSIR